MRKHNHVEAFCLMKYASADGKLVEHIWNSRDGVTPFIVSSRDGVELQHVEFARDRYLPDHKPQPDDRIFVDLTIERAREFAAEQVKRLWSAPEYPMADHYPSQEEAIVSLATEYMTSGGGGAPDLIEVQAAVAHG